VWRRVSHSYRRVAEEAFMIKGSQLTLYAANQSHRKLHKTVVQWVLDEIEKVGIHGATVTEISEGIDAHGRYHSKRFYELIDQPVAIAVVAQNPQIDELLSHLEAGGVKLFFTRCPVEFELLGEDDHG
jgi:PII-like signaling protein